jgi:hypothetical protein
MRDAAGGLMTCMKQLAMAHLLEQAARLATADRIRSFVCPLHGFWSGCFSSSSLGWQQ